MSELNDRLGMYCNVKDFSRRLSAMLWLRHRYKKKKNVVASSVLSQSIGLVVTSSMVDNFIGYVVAPTMLSNILAML